MNSYENLASARMDFLESTNGAWILSLSCHKQSSSNSGFASFLEWIRFVLFTPCPQYVISSVVQLLFLLFFLLLFVQRAISKFKKESSVSKTEGKRVGKLFIATLIIAAAVSLSYVGLEVWLVWLKFSKKLGRFSTINVIFTSLQTLKWLVFVTIVGHEKKFGASLHPGPLRAWWVVDFILSCLLVASGIARITVKALSYDYQLSVNDIFSFIVFPVSLFFLVLGIKGVTGIITGEPNNLTKPLLDGHLEGDAVGEPPTTGYAKAGIFSKAVWKWLTPLLEKGYKSPLRISDVPQLAIEDRAESNYARFKKEWPVTPGPQSVRSTLYKCFRSKLLHNGILAFIRLCVMYAGPILIQRFVSYTSGDRTSAYEGYYLVLILLVAKFIEVLSSHQYNFKSQKLGMLVRSTIIAAVYHKGLRLSSSSKQGHGVGQIVNYMAVDAQQLSDLMFQLHNLWILPAQVCIALAILYGVIGFPMLAGVAVMVAAVAFNFHSTSEQRQYQTSLMKTRDERMKATNEVLNFMKIIKFQAWEEHFLKRVEGYRNREYESLSKFMYALARNITMLWICPSLVATATFGACVLFNVQLTPATVFTATATFRILQEPIRAFPQTLISISQALVSLERLDKYMASDELDKGAVEQLPPGSSFAVRVEQGSFSWDDVEVKPVLQDINIDIKRGHLVTIVGTVGSGKSSLLTALLGEMRKLSGTVRTCGTTAYVPQTAWIQNATIEENILFGLPMDRVKYKRTVRACALEQDFKLMEYGDQTEIGERGINLSGGQKQRIQLARAVYQDSDMYLLDDVFSAVDAHTGTQLFQECILGALKGKTILLVTHQVEFLHAANLILVMRDGAIVQSGKYSELLEKGTDLEALVAAHHTAMESINVEKQGSEIDERPAGMEDMATCLEGSSFGTTCSPHSGSTKDLQRYNSSGRSLSFQRRPSQQAMEPQAQLKGSSKLIDEEQRESGHVGWNVYWLYITKAFGWPAVALLLLAQGSWTVISISSDYWLANETSKSSFNPNWFIEIYFFLSLASWLLVVARTTITTVTGLKTAQIFYFDMLRSIFRTTMAFFDTTPSGRILSRASTDQAQLDVLLPFFCGGTVATLLSTLGVLVVTCQVTWPLLFLILPLGWVFLSYQRYFIATSRELTRLDSITKAPVIFHFSETLAGIVTIRAFKKEANFAQLSISRVNTNVRMDFHNNAANEWLGFRLEMIGTTVLCSSALLLVALPANIIQPDRVGLSLSYGLALNSALFWSVWLACMVENKMVSVERIRQYTTIESEAPRINEAYPAPPNWPVEGTISMQNLQLRYRPNTPLVLKGITLTIRGGDKVGVVGRTGSGKSTLVQAFFRLVEPCGGRIIIDDVEITRLGLADLRSKFGIIPQEPILFEGSIRSNIDPLGQFTDDQIWEVLRRCQLAEVVQQKVGGLDSVVLDNGENWSVGQKQLFCLGRALLKQNRILFLDEATASVDAQTDAIMQKTIKEQFALSTVISVAHRIPSVMDSDKVLVMGDGEVKEYDRPSVLLERPTSLFAALVREYASRSGAAL